MLFVPYHLLAAQLYQESLVEGKDTCYLCLRKVGMCLRVHIIHSCLSNLDLGNQTLLLNFVSPNMQCSSGDCHITFHPTCARNSGFYMNTKGFGATSQHKAYCAKHSTQQKEVNLSIF